MMKYISLSLLFFILLASCSPSAKEKDSHQDGNIPTIELSNASVMKESFPLSNAVAKIDIVPLEVTDQSILGSINQVSVTTDDIWISHHKEAFVYRFSKDGKFLNKVGKVG